MNRIVELHNLYTELEPTHPCDPTDWQLCIHGLQRVLSMRILRREHPNIFPTVKD
jgi:hypothetical protein